MRFGRVSSWTPEEMELLASYVAQNVSEARIAVRLKRRPTSVRKKTKELGLVPLTKAVVRAKHGLRKNGEWYLYGQAKSPARRSS